ncbi:EAL domain-containing protein [uncultured Tateyamaria sp.]|uniref:putative bifunctional diguanylate cyclase/phosphodiesterase n=1 Tax=uncultured Tateyamaria sp. TaxID=455651 RepID=UPI0026282B34|nr:EAL domain-containing protein [uncultured Tateyamaria sp.]
MIPFQVFEQISDKCNEGLVLGKACSNDGAIMELRWCNKAFSNITGYSMQEIMGQRGTILIGPDMQQDKHLLIIEKLMNWEQFSVKLLNNRKNGELHWQKMSWVPLSDPVTGDRWWICSIMELEPQAEFLPKRQPTTSTCSQAETEFKNREKIQRLERENNRLQEIALSVAKESREDPLTGLSNRRHFQVELRSWIAELRASGQGFAAFYIDLDRFKSVNDTLGHHAGDKLLVCVADMLLGMTDETDLIARIGGDEFVVLRRLTESALNISELADNIVKKMQLPFTFEGKSASSSASVGVAIASSTMERPERIIADADKALYHAKAQGRGRWSYFTEEMHTAAIEEKRLSSDLLMACGQRQFEPYYQPIVEAVTGRLMGVEALVRWQHPTKGLIQPAEFLNVATSIGALRKIDEIVFGKLCATWLHFESLGIDTPRIAVNVSGERLADSNFIHQVRSSGIDLRKITFEILESVYLERMNDTVRWALDELTDLGVTIAIDDFGTGHASIQALIQIKPSVLKIDRQFVQPMTSDPTLKELVSSIVGIGKSLDMKIIAEGIESEDHVRIAKDMGCDYLQGFHFGEPMPVEDLFDQFICGEGKLSSKKKTKAKENRRERTILANRSWIETSGSI